MFIFDIDSNEKWMVYDASESDAAPVLCRSVRSRDDAKFIATVYSRRREIEEALKKRPTFAEFICLYEPMNGWADGDTAKFEYEKLLAGLEPGR